MADLGNRSDYRPLMVTITLGVALNDIFAYCVGKVIGGPKLLPLTSPGKTVAGSVGASCCWPPRSSPCSSTRSCVARWPTAGRYRSRTAMSRISVHYLARITMLAAVYFAAALVGLAFAIPPGNATSVWPGSGIALAAMLLLSMRVWPGVWVGALLANCILTDVSVPTAAAIATGNTLEALLAAWLCRRLLPPPETPFPGRTRCSAVCGGGWRRVDGGCDGGWGEPGLVRRCVLDSVPGELEHVVAGRCGRPDDCGPVGAGLPTIQARCLARPPAGRVGDSVYPDGSGQSGHFRRMALRAGRTPFAVYPPDLLGLGLPAI